jgi:hypothetical protein
MTLIEFVGFCISLIALIFLFGKKKYEERSQRQNPEQYRRKQQMSHEALSRMIGIELPSEGSKYHRNAYEDDDEDELEEVEEEVRDQQVKYVKARIPLKPISTSTSSFKKSAHWDPSLKATTNASDYQVNRQVGRSRGGDLIKALSSKRDLLIYKELFDKPMAMRKPFGDSSEY